MPASSCVPEASLEVGLWSDGPSWTWALQWKVMTGQIPEFFLKGFCGGELCATSEMQVSWTNARGSACGLVAPLSLFRIVLSHFPSDLEMLTASCSQLHFSASSRAMPRRLAPRPVYFLLPGTVAKAGLKNREVIEICRTQDFCLKFYTAEQCPTRRAAVSQYSPKVEDSARPFLKSHRSSWVTVCRNHLKWFERCAFRLCLAGPCYSTEFCHLCGRS
jgi:hypothetical protein